MYLLVIVKEQGELDLNSNLFLTAMRELHFLNYEPNN